MDLGTRLRLHPQTERRCSPRELYAWLRRRPVRDDNHFDGADFYDQPLVYAEGRSMESVSPRIVWVLATVPEGSSMTE